MKELSTMYRDRPIDPLDNAVYWVEYVLRFDTSLMRSLGGNIAWYQRRLLDVYFVILLAGVSVTFICGILSIKLLSYCLKIKQKVD